MRIRYQIMLLAVAVLGVYYPSLSAPLSMVDDPAMCQYLLNTDHFQLGQILFPGHGSHYRPLLLISFLVDKYVWGLEESFMHLNNILFHLGNTLLVFAVARKICRISGAAYGAAFAAALLFAVHPINTESVSWISGRTDPLAASFLLVSILALLERRRPLVSSAIAGVMLILACLVKETSMFFLPAALIFPFFLPEENREESTLGGTFIRHLPHFAVMSLSAASYFLLRRLALAGKDEVISNAVSGVAAKESFDLLLRLRMALKAVGFYAKKIFEPFPLNFAITHVSDLYVILGITVCALVIFWLVRRTLPSYLVLCAASIGCSAVVIAQLTVTWTPLAERYMYMPSAFFLIGAAVSVQRWEYMRLHRGAAAALVIVLAAIGAYGSFTRNLLWQDNLAFFQDTVRKNPNFMPARNELARALKELGRNQEAFEITKSFQMRDDLKNPQYGMISKAWGYAEKGDFVRAKSAIDEGLKSPGKLEVRLLQAMLEIYKMGNFQGKLTTTEVYPDTIRCLKRLYEITGDPFYQYRLGVVHLQQKEEQQALAAFRYVCKNAAADAYYRAPAEKLTAKLTAKFDESAAGGTTRQ